MKKTIVCTALLAAFAAVSAQSNPEKYAATITKEDLKKQLTIIAGAEMEGRETATEGQRKAAAYIADQFKQFGLLPAPSTKNYLQEYPLFYDTIVKTDLMIGGTGLEFGKDFSSGQSNKTKKFTASEIVFVGYGITDSNYNDYADKKVKGKVVLMFAGEPKSDSLYKVTNTTRPSKWSYQTQGVNAKLELAEKKGAKAVLFISPLTVTMRPEVASMRKTSIYYPRKAAKAATMLTLSHEAAAKLIGKEKFEALLAQSKNGRLLSDEKFTISQKVEGDFEKLSVPVYSSNVVGYIKGTDRKKEYVVLTAHYDHLGKRGNVISFGADDDGSGTVTVLEMAEAFAKAKAGGNGPRRSIIFMTVSGEEKGLWGSQYYSEHPLFPLKKTTVDLNTDMIGRIDPTRKYGDSMNYVYVIGEDKLSSDLMPITEEVNKQFTKLELDRKFNDLKDPNRIYYRSDHFNFAKKGVPIIFYFNGTHADYHRPSDTVDKINFGLMTRRAHLVFHTAWVMANRNDMLKRDIPLPAGAGERPPR